MANLYELLTPLLTCNNLPEEKKDQTECQVPQPQQDTLDSTKKPKKTLKSKPKQPPKKKNKEQTKKSKGKKIKTKKKKLEIVTKKNFL